MTTMQLLWASLGLTLVGFVLLWYGASYQEAILWVGLAVFTIGMALGPLGRFVGQEE